MLEPPKITIPRAFDAHRHPVAHEHPRIFGSAQRLKDLARQRPEIYQRMVGIARRTERGYSYEADAKIVGQSIAFVVEGSKADGRAAIDSVMKWFVNRPVRRGHTPFALDLANAAAAYDLCHELWTNDERNKLFKYFHATVAANVNSEHSPFHNGYYGYKNWGYGMAAYAMYHDDPESAKILADLEKDYLARAVPALIMAGDGGGWAEGFYVHYWLDSWLYFCEAARRVEGLDYYASAPEFYKHRALASMFEQYPTIMQKNSRRPISMGDGHGRVMKHVRDQSLTARRILVGYHRDDPLHQAIHAYNLQSPGTVIGTNTFRDFLYNDLTVKPGNLDAVQLSHLSPGPGYVYARSSWKEDATHFFFRSGRRFTSHQHLDNGHFHIFKHQELLGDGGHYDTFETSHAVNYYTRTIAHNSILIRDPDEKFPSKTPATPKGMRDGPPTFNDGGQAFPWAGTTATHNGYAIDVPHWYRNQELMDIASLPAFKDHGEYLYAAAEFTKAYSPKKAKTVTRQIVYIRPGTFIILDHVVSTNAAFKKSVLFQAAKAPEKTDTHWVITNPGPSEENGRPGAAGRLFIQILEPAQHAVELFTGADLYRYEKGGPAYPPEWLDPPAPECRMEVSPVHPVKSDYFLHVLTATDADVNEVPLARHRFEARDVVVSVGKLTIRIALKPAD